MLSEATVELGTQDSSLYLRVRATPQSAIELRERLGAWLEEIGALQDEAFDVTLACSEAYANAIGHPLKPSTLIVEVTGTIRDRLLTLKVRDYACTRPQRDEQEIALFLRLMQSLMESAQVHQERDGSSLVLQRLLRLGPRRRVSPRAPSSRG
jgi:anti-sigma regulatory factor (Ser/Thr protein kinase)